MAHRSCSFASTMRPDARIAGKVESDHGDLGMYRLRPEQNGFRYLNTGISHSFCMANHLIPANPSMATRQPATGAPTAETRQVSRTPPPYHLAEFQGEAFGICATLLTAYFGCQRSSVDFSSVYSYIPSHKSNPQQGRPGRASVSLSRSLKVVAVTFGRAGSGNPDALLSSPLFVQIQTR
jgi:hypothetical protein